VKTLFKIELEELSSKDPKKHLNVDISKKQTPTLLLPSKSFLANAITY
jgi:hypothetical protein